MLAGTGPLLRARLCRPKVWCGKTLPLIPQGDGSPPTGDGLFPLTTVRGAPDARGLNGPATAPLPAQLGAASVRRRSYVGALSRPTLEFTCKGQYGEKNHGPCLVQLLVMHPVPALTAAPSKVVLARCSPRR